MSDELEKLEMQEMQERLKMQDRRNLRSTCRLSWIRALVSLLAISSVSLSALAWNESGHRIIAASAAKQMSPQLQAEVVRVLKAHPRYDEDFAAFRPSRLKNLTEAQWLMGQAAQWPDHARSFENEPRRKREGLVATYHHGNWHYINLPVYLSKADRALEIQDPTRSARSGGELQIDDPTNVLEALRYVQAVLGSSESTDEQKGLWLSWALHLIADVHQPLHTAALFSAGRWPQGDRGGNEIKIIGSGRGRGKKRRLDSLHYYWDSAISNRVRSSEISKLTGVIEQTALPEISAKDVEPLKWIREGRLLANRVVYDPLRSQLLKSAPGNEKVNITGKYTRRAHAAALKRAALAARRTTLWLEQALLVR